MIILRHNLKSAHLVHSAKENVNVQLTAISSQQAQYVLGKHLWKTSTFLCSIMDVLSKQSISFLVKIMKIQSMSEPTHNKHNKNRTTCPEHNHICLVHKRL